MADDLFGDATYFSKAEGLRVAARIPKAKRIDRFGFHIAGVDKPVARPATGSQS